MEHPLAASEVTHELWSEHVKREWPHGCLPCTYTERDGLLGVAHLVVVQSLWKRTEHRGRQARETQAGIG